MDGMPPIELLEKARKHPVPFTRKRWEREVAGIEKYIRECTIHLADNGEKWLVNSLNYYKARLWWLKRCGPECKRDPLTGRIWRYRDQAYRNNRNGIS